MKSNDPSRRQAERALTLIELLVVIAIIGILAAIYLPVTARAKAKARKVQCVSNLRQIGYSFRMFSQEHQGRYPMDVSVRYGGTMEYNRRGDAYRHFQAMSNHMESAKLLLCPSDKFRVTTNWSELADGNISYLVGLDARPNNAFHILAADRNITNTTTASGRVMPVTTNSVLQWTDQLHGRQGNLLFADGHVEHADDKKLAKAIRQHWNAD